MQLNSSIICVLRKHAFLSIWRHARVVSSGLCIDVTHRWTNSWNSLQMFIFRPSDAAVPLISASWKWKSRKRLLHHIQVSIKFILFKLYAGPAIVELHTFHRIVMSFLYLSPHAFVLSALTTKKNFSCN